MGGKHQNQYFLSAAVLCLKECLKLISRNITKGNCEMRWQLFPSQNGWGWKGLLKFIWSNPILKPLAQAGPRRSSCPGPCPDGFLVSPRRVGPPPLWLIGSPPPANAQSPSQLKSAPWCFRGNLCFSLCPLPSVLSVDTTGKSLALSSLYPRFEYTQVRAPWVFSRLNSHNFLSLFLLERC